uniref:Ciliary rootlet coiled-coil, rootletin n=1 Tax=Maylandia zebra TaxID=106582 RepID=A0A3P9BZZ5_9CICH
LNLCLPEEEEEEATGRTRTRLEESVLSEEKRLTVRGPSPDAPPTCLPARVREIVTKNLSDNAGAMSSVMSLQEENRVLQGELARLEDLLAHSRADRDELAIKYGAISERLEQALRFETGDEDHDSPESRSLAQQNVDLRRRLDEEQAAYKRKLTAYQEGQQRQAQLVQKLQAKVLQYKKRCGDLDQALQEKSSELEKNSVDEASSNLEDALIRLEEEQQRSSSLSAVNAMLREQLEQAGLANEALSQDIRRLTADWTKAREELEQKESDWRREEESFHSYFSSEHSRLLTLWRQVVGFRRHVCEMKSATERDLSDMRNELARTSHSAQVSWAGLCATLQSREGGAVVALEQEKALRVQLEQQLRGRVAEMMSFQSRMDAERSELNVRSGCRAVLQEQSGSDETDMQMMRTHTETLLDTLRDIAQVNNTHIFTSADFSVGTQMEGLHFNLRLQTVSADGESSSSEADQDNSGALIRDSFPRRPSSPTRPSSLSPLPEAALSALRSAVTNKTLQLQDVRSRLLSAQSSVQQLRKQLSESESAKRDAEQRSQTLQRERDAAQREREAALRERDRVKQERDTLASEKVNLEKTVQAAQSSSQLLQMDCEKLQLTVASVQRERDHEREEKEAAVQERDRAKAETLRVQKQFDQSESRASAQRGELSAVRETHQQGEVQRQLLEQEKTQLSEALARAESKNTELCLLLNKLQSEDAALRDSLAKMGSMNEGLAQDKAALNTYILKLEEEKAFLQTQKRDAEQEKLTIRDELVRLEQDRLKLESARITLQQSLQDAELSRVGIEVELQSLRAERLKLQEKVTQVTSLGSELSLARGEGQRNEVALEEVGRSQAELARDKAALVVQLTASERENAMLSEELAAFRSERESLETSLFEVQQQLVQVETRREQLETENQTLRVRCETAAGERRPLYFQTLNAAQLEAQQALRKASSEHQEEVERLVSEKEVVRHSLLMEHEVTLRKLRQEMEDQLSRAKREKEELQDEMRTLQHDRDQCLLQAETEKQQALSLKEAEKTVLSERVSSLQAELSAAALETERVAREAAHYKEQEQIRVGALTSEVLELRSQLEDAASARERELHSLQETCSDLRSRADIALKELEQCRAALAATEESRDQLRRDLLETERRLNQTQDSAESYRREGTELRRGFSDVTKEREALSQSNTYLRETLRSAETERIRHAVISLTSEQNLGNMLHTVLPLNVNFPFVWLQLKVLDGEKEQKEREVAELQTRLSLEEQRDEERGKEVFTLKQKLAEAETARESLKKEVRKRLLESESGWRSCERELTAQLQEARSCEKKLQDEAKNLSLRAQTAQDSAAHCSLQLSEAQGRLAATESELTRAEATRRDLEFRLSSLQSALTRTLGIGASGRGPRGRSPGGSSTSPGSAVSPERGDTPVPLLQSELDSETVRSGLRDFLQELRDAQKERDDVHCQLGAVQRELEELKVERDSAMSRLTQLQVYPSWKRGLDERLTTTQILLQQQEEAVRRGDRERRALSDRVKDLERALQASETDKKHIQKDNNGKRALSTNLERKRLREALEAAEARATRVELGRRSLEGELQRLKLSLGDREAESQASQERRDSLVKQVQSCLFMTHDQLNAIKLFYAVKEQMDASRASLAEARRNTATLTERVQSLQTELTESELRREEVESELKSAQEALRQRSASLAEAQRSAQSAQTERAAVEERLRALQRAVAMLETEKKDAERQAVRLEKDKNALRNTLDKVERQKLKSEEGTMRLSAEKSRLDRSLNTAEQELQEAQQQILMLQTQLAEMEQSHSLCESLVRQREEAQREAERLRTSFRDIERTLGTRERAHRHRVKGLEEQVSTLKEQLQQEMKRRQPSLPSSVVSAGNRDAA